jgi:hypothetical protein
MALGSVDDSVSSGDPPCYVLAGYSAEESTWEAFWPQWQSALDLTPKIEYFQMSEAETLEGQFAGFSTEQRNQRLSVSVEVI